MWFGKPMVVLPIFWDQHDNAQRVDETGYGIRLPTYALTAASWRGRSTTLLDDEELRRAAPPPASGCAAGREPSLAAELIERVAATGEPPPR